MVTATILAGIMIAGCSGSDDSAGTETVGATEAIADTTVAATAEPTTTLRPRPERTTTTLRPRRERPATTTTLPSSVIPPGMYIVNDTILPGTYRAAAYWARLDASQEIIDNGLFMDCPSILIVDPTDSYIELGGGALPLAESIPMDPIAEGCTDGVFLVGLDILPGRYSVTAAGGDDAYWARLDGTLEIIDNDLGPGQRIVIVDPGDFALEIGGGTLAPLP